VIPAGELWAGRPARKMRDLSDEDLAHNRMSAVHYVEVARAHRLGFDGGPFETMNRRPLPPRD
jgi:carbonic anhydrase/acetyltransferase-like protein (isoleucine patch superfamily)